MTFIKKAQDIINSFNMTSLRILVTLGCIILTVLTYCASAFIPKIDWTPNMDYLIWLALLSGIDVGSYWVKRWTHVTSDGEAVGQKIKKSNNPVPEQNNVPNTPNSSEEGILKDDDEGLATTDISEIKENEKG